MSSPSNPPAWLGPLSWLPVAAYFLIRYVIIGRENMTNQQSYLLIGFVIMAEIALWQYRKQFRTPQNENEDGTDPNR